MMQLVMMMMSNVQLLDPKQFSHFLKMGYILDIMFAMLAMMMMKKKLMTMLVIAMVQGHTIVDALKTFQKLVDKQKYLRMTVLGYVCLVKAVVLGYMVNMLLKKRMLMRQQVEEAERTG